MNSLEQLFSDTILTAHTLESVHHKGKQLLNSVPLFLGTLWCQLHYLRLFKA